jgi:hypothetical protein
MPGSKGCGKTPPNPDILSPAFGAKDLHSVFSSQCRFFGACWRLRMTFVAFFRRQSSPALHLKLRRRVSHRRSVPLWSCAPTRASLNGGRHLVEHAGNSLLDMRRQVAKVLDGVFPKITNPTHL